MKDAFPRKCVGCGHCCLKGICVAGYLRMQTDKPVKRCVYLKWSGSRYICELVQKWPKEFGVVLNIGEGCCQPLNTWRNDVKDRG